MASSTVGIGVVGAGAIGIRAALMHLSVPDVHDRVRLTAVCDPVPGRAEAAAKTYGVPAWYESYEELLADPNVDAVTLCTPIGIHYEQGMQAIEAGKHIHFNKTMTTEVWEADNLIKAAAKQGVHMVASPGMMLMPANRRARQAVLEGRLGRLVWAITGATGVAQYHLDEEFRTGEDVLTDVDPSWYYRRPGGGPQYDVTVYCLHNLTGIVGPAKRVTAMSGLVIPERSYHGKTIECDMDDSTMLLVDFGDAFFSMVYATLTGNLLKGFNPNIYGTDGAIVGGELNGESLRQEGDHEPHVTGKHQELRESHVFEDIMQLVDLIRDDTPTIATPEHARHVIDIIEAGYRAAETGETQELTTTFDPLPIEALIA